MKLGDVVKLLNPMPGFTEHKAYPILGDPTPYVKDDLGFRRYFPSDVFKNHFMPAIRPGDRLVPTTERACKYGYSYENNYVARQDYIYDSFYLVNDMGDPIAFDVDYLLVNFRPYTEPSAPSCHHTWDHYPGLFEQYDFCTKCDVRRAV